MPFVTSAPEKFRRQVSFARSVMRSHNSDKMTKLATESLISGRWPNVIFNDKCLGRFFKRFLRRVLGTFAVWVSGVFRTVGKVHRAIVSDT